MKHPISTVLLILVTIYCYGQSDNPWIIEAKNIDPANYYGVTVANGIVGLVSSPEPMKVKDVVLNGAFDTYGRGRVDNILKGFNFINMNLDVDNQRIGPKNISGFRQYLDMKKALLITEFDFQDKIHVKHSLAALRHLPFSALTIIEIEARKDVMVSPASVIESPDILRDIKNMYAVIDRPHVKIPLMTSVGMSPSGKHTVAASTSFIFDKNEIPPLVHEDWDYSMPNSQSN
jgi:trehalose/maltose hydrolase-like predicted phosphorylase